MNKEDKVDYSRERPTRTTLSLVLNFSDSSLSAPVDRDGRGGIGRLHEEGALTRFGEILALETIHDGDKFMVELNKELKLGIKRIMSEFGGMLPSLRSGSSPC